MLKHIFSIKADETTYQYGMSPTHLRINVMQNLCKGFLYQDVQSWSMPKALKHLKAARMAELQSAAKTKLGLNLYKVFAGKQGNSNSGNTSRKLFAHPDVFADIIDYDADIIDDLGTLINAQNSLVDIDGDKVDEFAKKLIDKFYASARAWNWFNASTHGLVIHGGSIIRFLPTAPGYWIEEGGEASHKFDRHRRLHNARNKGHQHFFTAPRIES